MPFMEAPEVAGKKRKRVVATKKNELGDSAQKFIQSLETGIIETRANYNDIVELQQIAEDVSRPKASVAAAVALCRVFCALLAGGSLTKSKDTPQTESLLVDWLKEQYAAYSSFLLTSIADESGAFVLKLVMALVKEESASFNTEHVWRHGLFLELVEALVAGQLGARTARDAFVDVYLNEYDDVRYYTFCALARPTHDDVSIASPISTETNNIEARIYFLCAVDPPEEDDEMVFFGQEPQSKKHALRSLAKHKKQAQEAWVKVLRSETSERQRKEILSKLTDRIAPWFLQVDMLADFLTDSYSAGDAMSLLALSGIFQLITERNLDYPSFYVRLYALLDEGLLHSKHRSRFFRHLETFMSSSHLPAVLVASFIKRLARLSLSAPPAGIIAVCPWIFNMLKAHPQCTFMIHREAHDPALKKQLEEQGTDDPFDMNELDPMTTGAIDSSLWEIETLQSHYHPNVASLAKIISEQFTKQDYKLEDFLDHSYASIVGAELGRELKKTPVTEWQIPKYIFTKEEGGLNDLGTLLQQIRGHA